MQSVIVIFTTLFITYVKYNQTVQDVLKQHNRITVLIITTMTLTSGN